MLLRTADEARLDLAELVRLAHGHMGDDPDSCDIRCPTHRDQHPSLTVSRGNEHDLVWYCHRKTKGDGCPGCDPAIVRADLVKVYGASDELLGTYKRSWQPTRDDRRNGLDRGCRDCSSMRAELTAYRAELADRDNRIADGWTVLRDPSIGPKEVTLLRLRMALALDGREMPGKFTDIASLARKAGGGRSQSFEWAGKLSLSDD
jgi:hypothetical protein